MLKDIAYIFCKGIHYNLNGQQKTYFQIYIDVILTWFFCYMK